MVKMKYMSKNQKNNKNIMYLLKPLVYVTKINGFSIQFDSKVFIFILFLLFGLSDCFTIVVNGKINIFVYDCVHIFLQTTINVCCSSLIFSTIELLFQIFGDISAPYREYIRLALYDCMSLLNNQSVSYTIINHINNCL